MKRITPHPNALRCALFLASFLALPRPSDAADRPPINLPPLRQDASGLVVIEAENFDTNAAQGIHRWEFTNSPAGFTGAGTMYALPDEPVAVIDYPDSLTTSPRLDYKVNFIKTGTHYFWFRGSDGGGNSVNAGLDGDSPDPTMNNIDEGCCGTRLVPGGTTFTWVRGIDATADGRSKFEVTTTGVHTINFWMREDGQIVDKMLITTDPNFTPSGAGPAESARVGDPFPPTVSLTAPAANSEVAPNTAVTVTADATDSDGTISKVEFFAGTNKIGEDTSTPFAIQFTPAEAGTLTLTARATDSSNLQVTSGGVTIFVSRPATTLPPLRQGDDGLIVLEAENFHTNTAQGIHAWRFDRTPAGYTGEGTMYALPDEPVAVIDYPDSLTTSPRLDYRVEFTKTGTHYFWFRGSDGGGNSVNAGLDGDSPDPTMNNIDEGCCGTRLVPGGTSFTWVRGIDATPEGRSRFEITQTGVHTVNFWMREDGQIVDKMLITTDPNYVPSGAGPAESPRAGDPFPPTVSLNLTANQQFPTNAPVTITADARDRDGTITKVEFFEGSNKIGEPTSSPFTIQFSPTQERAFTISAKVTDNSGLTAVSGGVKIIYGNPPAILFTGDNPLGQAGDVVIINRLENQGFLISAIDDDDVQPADAAGKALIIISSTVSSGDINTKFTDATVPIIVWEEAVMDELLMTGDSGADPDHHGSTANLDRIDILAPDHPLAAGLSGTVPVTTSAQTMSWGVSDATPTNAVVVARVAGDTTKWAIWAFEKGAILFDGATPAPERRIGFFFNGGSTTANTPAAFQLFDAAVNWALRRQVVSQTTTLRVTRAGAQLRISWTPSGGTLETTTALSNAASWTPVANAANPHNATTSESFRFFRVRR
jgi:hypothetical protein